MTAAPDPAVPPPADEVMPEGICCGRGEGDWRPVRGGPTAPRCQFCRASSTDWRRQE